MSVIVRSFGEMVSEVRRASSVSTSNTDMVASIKAYLNEEYVSLCRLVRSAVMRGSFETTLAAVVQSDTEVPVTVADAPADIQDDGIISAELRDTAETPDRHHPLAIKTLDEFRAMTQAHARGYDVGTPSIIAVLRQEGVRLDVQDAAVAYEVLSSTTDTTDTVSAYGFTDANQRSPRQVEVTLTGTTPVTLGTFRYLLSVGKSGDTAGTITVRKTVATTVVAVLAPGDRSAAYTVFVLHRANDRALVLHVEYFRSPPLMVNDSDVPFYLPATAGRVLVEGAKARALRFREDVDWKGMEADYQAARQEFLITAHGRTERGRLRLA